MLRVEQRGTELPIRKRSGAALADQIERLYVTRQAEALADVAREARAEIAGAGGDDDRVDGCRLERAAPQCGLRRIGRDLRGMFGKAPLQRIGLYGKHFFERVYREPPGVHSVVARQHQSRERARAFVEAQEPVRGDEGGPTVAFRVTPARSRRSERVQIHRPPDGASLLVRTMPLSGRRTGRVLHESASRSPCGRK